MPLSTATVTINVKDILGVNYSGRRTPITVRTNIPDETIVEKSTGNLRVGTGRVTMDESTGVAQVTVWVPSSDANPASWQTYFDLEYEDRATRAKKRKTYGPFTITADADLGDLIEEQAVQPTYLSQVTEQLDAKVAEAEAAADLARDISEIDTTDDAIDVALNLPDGKAAATLEASYARQVSLAKYLPLGNTGSGLVAQAFVDAAAEAGPGGSIFIPKYLGPYTLDAAGTTLSEVSLESDGAIINVTSGVGAGAALTITSPAGARPYMRVGGFKLVGPGARTIGVANAGGATGIKITGQAKPTLDFPLEVRFFDKGIDYANDVGHITARGIDINNNFYGVYFSHNTYDYNFLDGCIISGNTFANFATPADQGIGRLTFENGHLGYAPYGIYQEPTPAAQGANRLFLSEVTLKNARFEQIGNAAIWTDATQSDDNFSISESLIFEHAGFSWGNEATYRIAGRPRTHAVLLSQTARIIEIKSGPYPFTSGDGTAKPIRIKRSGHAAVRLVGANALRADVQVDVGAANVAAYARTLEEIASVAGDVTNAIMGLGTSSGYLQPGGSASRRFGADGAYVYVDFNNDFRFRNSGSSYALVGRIATDRIVMPRFQVAESGPTVTAGTGAPTANEPDGSIYLRKDGGAGTALYSRIAGAWVANA